MPGLKGVLVDIRLRPDGEKYGLTKEQLQTQVELQLRKYGINVLSQKEWADTLGQPSLDIEVDLAINKELQLCAVSYQVFVRELVMLKRVPQKPFRGITLWRVGGIQLVSAKRLNQTVRDTIDVGLNEFCNDYLVANPKEQKKLRYEQE